MLFPILIRVWIIALPVVAVFLAAGRATSEDIVQMGFSRAAIGEVNDNDTLAALKLWSTQLMAGEEYQVSFEPTIYNNIGEIKTAIKQNRVDLISLSSVDFYHVQHMLGHEQFIVAVFGGSITVEYLLLVNEKSGFADIKDLKKAVLRFPNDTRAALGAVWLDVRLAKAGQPAAKQFFDKVVPVNKITEAVLPVFFGKKDACLVPRTGFDTMAELNPQISRRLKIVAASKGYIPGLLAFRKDYHSGIKAVILDSIKNWNQIPAGQQILTMFQLDDLVLNSMEVLGPTMELIKEHQRLFGADTGAFRLEFEVWPQKYSWVTVR